MRGEDNVASVIASSERLEERLAIHAITPKSTQNEIAGSCGIHLNSSLSHVLVGAVDPVKVRSGPGRLMDSAGRYHGRWTLVCTGPTCTCSGCGNAPTKAWMIYSFDLSDQSAGQLLKVRDNEHIWSVQWT